MLILHHDHPSAAALHAILLLEDLVGDRVRHHGIDVLGLDAALPATLDDVEAWSRHREQLGDLGWEVPRPRRHPPTLAVHAVERLCADDATARAWRHATYRAHWLEDRDVGDHAVLVDVAVAVGLDGDRVAARITDRAALAGVRREMMAVRGDGVGGVPVLDVDGTKVSPFMAPEDLRALAGL